MATEFPCSLTINTPFPDHRLAVIALRAIRVDEELSPLVKRSFSLRSNQNTAESQNGTQGLDNPQATILQTVYRATTNRMLRVSVNGFMESLKVVIQVMEELDADMLDGDGKAPDGPDESIDSVVWR